MNLSELNKLAKNPLLPKKKMSEMEKGKLYPVTSLRQISTKFGLKTIAEFNDNDDEDKFHVFLPNRISKSLEENQQLFEDLSHKAQTLNLFIMSHGDDKFEFVV